jgi:hypothetical protein
MSGARTAPLPDAATRAAGLPVLVLYSATLVLSAALVFMVQPMFARFLLPLLGGTPGVWTVALLFFQTALLLAYLYVHWTTRRFGVRRQAALHLALVAAALIVLPIGVPDGWSPPTDSAPILWLLALLVVAVGLPYFVVSSTAPLLQSWLADTDHPDAHDPYFLYRASNVGSVIGLLAYPVLVEPTFTLDGQSWLWSAGYGLLGLLVAGCAAVLWRSPRRTAGARPAQEREGADEPITTARRVRWIALAFVPSTLMLGATTTLSLNVAPMPFLWVLPLSLYLLSFIVVFSRAKGREFTHRLALLAMPVAAAGLALVVALEMHEPLWAVVVIHLGALFVIALGCHGELAKDRPSASHLTEFYALVSVGGALGGLFNGVLAPIAFDSLTEYPIAVILACFMVPGVAKWSDQVSLPRHVLPALLVGGGAFAALHLTDATDLGRWTICGVAAVVCVALSRHSLRFGLAVAGLLVAAWAASLGHTNVIHQERSFFGVHRVEESDDEIIHELRHGTIVHGGQIGGIAIDPTTYYHREGPAGQLLEALPDRGVVKRAALVGLGAGTMACHARKGEHWTFFEIDPAVERIARENRLFSYLRDCDGRYDVVLGDGRLSLEKQRDARFGFIVLDAFGSDAVPVHLLTREAVELYSEKLAPHGVMAFHISNSYLDLEPVVGNVASAIGLTCFAQSDQVSQEETARKYKLSSQWVAMARGQEDLGKVTGDKRWSTCATDDGREWTDDYSNVLGAVRWSQ